MPTKAELGQEKKKVVTEASGAKRKEAKGKVISVGRKCKDGGEGRTDVTPKRTGEGKSPGAERRPHNRMKGEKEARN